MNQSHKSYALKKFLWWTRWINLTNPTHLKTFCDGLDESISQFLRTQKLSVMDKMNQSQKSYALKNFLWWTRWINLTNRRHSKTFCDGLGESISKILCSQKRSVMDLILAACQIQNVTFSVFGPMQLTAKRKPWKLIIENKIEENKINRWIF